MKTVNVTLAHHTYPIYIGKDLLKNAELLQQHIAHKQVMVVSNETIAALFLSSLTPALNHYQMSNTLLPDGESYKTLDTATQILNDLVTDKHRRNTTLIALGGGVIGDITGFAAHCYQRGVPFIQIPTTLLAQVDSSIGGKTGVNHPDGKNMIGAFHQPQCVIIDINTLKTLPEREYRSGLAEVIKHALILDKENLNWLESHIGAIMARESEALIEMIEHSCKIKANIVVQDEKEHLGIRQLLNFGHTFAHAIETATHYSTYLHGEAVAIGMVMAARLSQQLGQISEADVMRITTLLQQAGLPTTLEQSPLPPQLTIDLMRHDKKNKTDQLSVVALKSLGHAEFYTEIDLQLVEKTLSIF